jgi:hypothetical protein
LKIRIVNLPGVCVAAAGGDTARCVAGGRLLAFNDAGEALLDVPMTQDVTQLACARDLLVAIIKSGRLAWLDPETGRVLAEQAAGDAPRLVSGGGAIWAVDTPSSRAWRVRETGVLDAPRSAPGIDEAAADGDRLWWTSRDDTQLRDFARAEDIGRTASERGALAACSNSVWISVRKGLCRVGAWDAKRGLDLAAPYGPVPFLVCAQGALVGATAGGEFFSMDPRIDADVRAFHGAESTGPLGHVIAVNDAIWAFTSGRNAAHVIGIR